MNTEQAKQLADNALNLLIEALEKGQSETLTRYLATMGRFRSYSFGNCMLIAAQRPDASHVAGFHAWLKFQRHVRKGEKGIVILAPMIGKKKTEAPEDEQSTVFGFRAAHVFDISQTDGEPLAEFAQVHGDPQEFTPRLKAMIGERGIVLDYSDKIAPAKGMASAAGITLLPGMDDAEEFAVLVHEFAHRLLHFGDRRASTNKTIRETEAEAVAFVVSQAIGLDCGTAASDYISLYQGNKTTLLESLSFIQRTAAEILAGIEAG